jgi:hypothetical protein
VRHAPNFAPQASADMAWTRARWFRIWTNLRAHGRIRETLHVHEKNCQMCVHMQIVRDSIFSCECNVPERGHESLEIGCSGLFQNQNATVAWLHIGSLEGTS